MPRGGYSRLSTQEQDAEEDAELPLTIGEDEDEDEAEPSRGSSDSASDEGARQVFKLVPINAEGGQQQVIECVDCHQPIDAGHEYQEYGPTCMRCCQDRDGSLYDTLTRLYIIFKIVFAYRCFYWLSISAMGVAALRLTTCAGGPAWGLYVVYVLLLVLHVVADCCIAKRLSDIRHRDFASVRQAYVTSKRSRGILGLLRRWCQAVVLPPGLCFSVLDHLDGMRDTTSMALMWVCDDIIHDRWIASWAEASFLGKDNLLPLLERMHFAGMMLFQFIAFTFVAQFLMMTNSHCLHAAIFMVFVWAPDWVVESTKDPNFLFLIVALPLVGVPLPYYKVAAAVAALSCWWSEMSLTHFVFVYGVVGLVYLGCWTLSGGLNYCLTLRRRKEKDISAEERRHMAETMVSTLGQLLESSSLIASSELLFLYGEQPSEGGAAEKPPGCCSCGAARGVPHDAVLAGCRMMVKKVVLEGCREMWFQASFFSLIMHQLTPVAQIRFVTLLLLAIISALVKAKDYICTAGQYYSNENNINKAMKGPTPPDISLANKCDNFKKYQQWLTYTVSNSWHPTANLVADLSTFVVIPLGLATVILAIMKVFHAYLCQNGVWNMTSGCA